MRAASVLIALFIVIGTASLVMGMGSTHKEGAPVTGESAVAAAKAKGMPVLLDAGSDHCKPCKRMMPVLDSLKKKYAGKVAVVFVNVEDEMSYASGLGITMIPTQILYDRKGKEIARHVGELNQQEAEKFIGGVL